MIKITKNKEPQKWTEFRCTPGVNYQSIPELVDSLLQEQGYICAYCMRRIPHKDRIVGNDGVNFVLSDEDHRVEHILSRNNHQNKQLDYTNMVICCPGHIGGEDHCDRLKGSRDVTFNLFDEAFIETLSYKSDGEILSSNVQYNKEINEILNLNTPLLKANRKESWTLVKQELIKRGEQRDRAILNQMISKYSNMHKRNGKMQYIPYCGMPLFFLKKKVMQLK